MSAGANNTTLNIQPQPFTHSLAGPNANRRLRGIQGRPRPLTTYFPSPSTPPPPPHPSHFSSFRPSLPPVIPQSLYRTQGLRGTFHLDGSHRSTERASLPPECKFTHAHDVRTSRRTQTNSATHASPYTVPVTASENSR